MLKTGTNLMVRKKRRFTEMAGEQDRTVDRILDRHGLRSPPKRMVTVEGSRLVQLRQPGSESRVRVQDEPMEMQEERKTPESDRGGGRSAQQDDVGEFELGF